MRSILPTATLVLFSWTAVQAQIVEWPIAKKHVSSKRGGLQRRAAGKTTQEDLINDKIEGGYFATCSMGTPPQNLTMQLDTGSSDVWVPSSKAKICTDASIQGGCTLGTFNPDDSSTFYDVGPGDFEITFIDNSEAKGDYFQDRFVIGDVALDNLTMGLAMDTTIPYGLVGVGYSSNEAIAEYSDETFPNVPEALVAAGAINSAAYSLWLNDLGANTGSILFGGIDTEKYVGNLTRINILKENKDDPSPAHFTVALTSLIAVSSSGSDTLTSSFPIEAVLDSGTTLTYLPQELAEEVWAEVGAVYDADSGGAIVPCSSINNVGYFSFGFAGPDGPRINVTMDELVLSLSDERGPPSTFSSGALKGQLSCAFGIQNSTESPMLLGDTFLRSAYVVYDLVNNQIGIAKTDFNSTKSNIVPFPSNGATIPSSTAAPNQNVLSRVSGPSSTQSTLSAADGFKKGSGNSKDSPASHVAPSLSVMAITLTFAMFGSGIFARLR